MIFFKPGSFISPNILYLRTPLLSAIKVIGTPDIQYCFEACLSGSRRIEYVTLLSTRYLLILSFDSPTFIEKGAKALSPYFLWIASIACISLMQYGQILAQKWIKITLPLKSSGSVTFDPLRLDRVIFGRASPALSPAGEALALKTINNTAGSEARTISLILVYNLFPLIIHLHQGHFHALQA